MYVVFDVPKHPRHTYRVWEEGKGPDVVLEILSPTTWQKGVQDNPSLDRDLGVREYTPWTNLANQQYKAKGWMNPNSINRWG